MSAANTKEIFAAILTKGGVTLNQKNEIIELDYGYQVGIPGYEVVRLLSGLSLSQVGEILYKLRLEAPLSFIGVWVDEEGHVYFDVSNYVPVLEDAIRVGVEFQQKAIWDWAKKESIYLRVS